MGREIDIEQKECKLIIHDNDHDPWVTIVGCVNVTDRNLNHFRCRSAIDLPG